MKTQTSKKKIVHPKNRDSKESKKLLCTVPWEVVLLYIDEAKAENEVR